MAEGCTTVQTAYGHLGGFGAGCRRRDVARGCRRTGGTPGTRVSSRRRRSSEIRLRTQLMRTAAAHARPYTDSPDGRGAKGGEVPGSFRACYVLITRELRALLRDPAAVLAII